MAILPHHPLWNAGELLGNRDDPLTQKFLGILWRVMKRSTRGSREPGELLGKRDDSANSCRPPYHPLWNAGELHFSHIPL